jgi:LysM domain
MSAAIQFVPTVSPPAAARPRQHPSATVVSLRRPRAASVAAPVRLTRRGVYALGVAVASLAALLVWAAWLSAPGSASSRSWQPATITVHDGDTLWSIATRIAPQRDPRAEVAELQRRNHLHGVALAAGQVLHTRWQP